MISFFFSSFADCSLCCYKIHLHCKLTDKQRGRETKTLHVTNRLGKKQQAHRSKEKMPGNRRIRSTNAFIRSWCVFFMCHGKSKSQIEWVHCSRFHEIYTQTQNLLFVLLMTLLLLLLPPLPQPSSVQSLQIMSSVERSTTPKWNCIALLNASRILFDITYCKYLCKFRNLQQLTLYSQYFFYLACSVLFNRKWNELLWTETAS